MDIRFEISGFNNPTLKEDYYRQKLIKKFSGYEFLKVLDFKIQNENNVKSINILAQPERAKKINASSEGDVESQVFSSVLKKLKVQLEKYKVTHYHTSRKSLKNKNSAI